MGSISYEVMADFNGDGKLDVAALSYSSGKATVVLGNGLGGFTSSSPLYDVWTGTKELIAVDLDEDGKLDLVGSGTYSGAGAITYLRGKGDGTFYDATYFYAGTEATSLAIGDFTGNSHKDVVTLDASAGKVRLLSNSLPAPTPTTTTPTPSSPPPDPPPSPTAGANFDVGTLAFGNVAIGATRTLSTQLNSTGSTSLQVLGVSANPSDQFTVSHNCSGSMAPGQSCQIQVQLQPRTSGPISGTLVVTANSGSYTVGLTATGIPSLVEGKPIIVKRSDGKSDIGVTVVPASTDVGKPGALYVYACIDNTLCFYHANGSWHVVDGRSLMPAFTGSLPAEASYPLALGVDSLSALAVFNLNIIVAAGSSESDVLGQNKYKIIPIRTLLGL